jgi:hypothetical protein
MFPACLGPARGPASACSVSIVVWCSRANKSSPRFAARHERATEGRWAHDGSRPKRASRYLDGGGRYWARWADAVLEAGLEPNEQIQRLADEGRFEQLTLEIRRIGRFPTDAERRMRSREDARFPTPVISGASAGTGACGRCSCLLPGASRICRCAGDCRATAGGGMRSTRRQRASQDGFVYLLKSGRHYKLGRTNSAGRREYELAIQLPERASKVHEIRTDDPVG